MSTVSTTTADKAAAIDVLACVDVNEQHKIIADIEQRKAPAAIVARVTGSKVARQVENEDTSASKIKHRRLVNRGGNPTGDDGRDEEYVPVSTVLCLDEI